MNAFARSIAEALHGVGVPQPIRVAAYRACEGLRPLIAERIGDNPALREHLFVTIVGCDPRPSRDPQESVTTRS